MIWYTLIWFSFIPTWYLMNWVSFNLRPFKWGVKSFFSREYCDTQKQSSGEFVKFIANCAGVPFETKLQATGRLKRGSNTVFLRTLPKDCSENFFTFFWQFFTCISEIIETFWERFIFQIIELFLLFMPVFYTMEPRHVDESSNRTKQRLHWQIIHASVNITQIRNFLCSF